MLSLNKWAAALFTSFVERSNESCYGVGLALHEKSFPFQRVVWMVIALQQLETDGAFHNWVHIQLPSQ